MSKLTELLNQIHWYVQHYSSCYEEMQPGLSLEEIQTQLEKLPYKLPQEIIELYQWRNGGINSFLPSPEGGYDLQSFLPLEQAVFLAGDWIKRSYTSMNVFPIFYLEDIMYWTVGSQEKQELAPIYYRGDPPRKRPDYQSLVEMLEREIERLREIWLI